MSVERPLRIDRRDDGVVLLTLDLPERRNAMTAEMTEAWEQALDELRTDPALRCLVITGTGSSFCSGGDLSWISESPDLTVDRLRTRMLAFYRAWLAVRDLEVPTVAAVNGPAIGAGLCLALACDVRYAAASARFAAPFTVLGMHPGMAATWLLPATVGMAAARELLFTGRSVDADEAQRLGLVTAVYSDDYLLSEALATATRIAAAAPIATRLTKAALAGGGHRSLEDALEWEGLAQPVTLATSDLREGLAAAREKRPPSFRGH